MNKQNNGKEKLAEMDLHTYEHTVHDKGGMSSEERKESLENHPGETGCPY